MPGGSSSVRVEDHLGLVYAQLRGLGHLVGASPAVDLDDLVADGFLGLTRAAQTFDPGRGTAFSTWAVPQIRGAMVDGLRRMAFRRVQRPALKAQLSLEEWLEEHEDWDNAALADDDPAWSPEGALDRVAAREAVRWAVGQLKGTTRVVAGRMLAPGTSDRALARDLGLSHSRVFQYRRQALKQMKRALVAQGGYND